MGMWDKPERGTQDAGVIPEAWRHPAPTLMPVNVEDGWMDGAWRTWPSPVSSIVYGGSHHADLLVELTGPPRPQGYLAPVVVTFRLEPTNPFDPNAVRVELGEQHVGYIARDLAPTVAGAMTALNLSECEFAGLLRGGYLSATEDHQLVSVMVWLSKSIKPAPSLSLGETGFTYRRGWPPDEDEGRD